MKVLFLNYEYPPLGGGASVATEAILTEFGKREGITAHLVTSAVGRDYERLTPFPHVVIHRLPIGKNPKKLHSQSLRDLLSYSWKAFFFLPRLLRNEKEPFTVTLAFFTTPCGFLASLLKLWHGMPYVVSLRGADVPGFSEKYDRLYFFLAPLIRFVWREATFVVPNSVGLKGLAEKTSAEQPMEIIENGIDTEKFYPREGGPVLKPIFLSVSRLTPRKGIRFLIEAFAVARAKGGDNMELWIAGEGEEKEALEGRAQELGMKERVRFLGRVEHERVPELLRQASVFVLPSKNEGMSNSALEAMASGLPLVVSGTGGMQELVENGTNGFFVDPEKTDEFAEMMLRFERDPGLITKLGAESRRRAETRSWSRVADHFLTLLQKA